MMDSTAINSGGWVRIEVNGQALEARLLIGGVPVRTAGVWQEVSQDIVGFLTGYQQEGGGFDAQPLRFSVLHPQADTASAMRFRVSRGGKRLQVPAQTLELLGAEFSEMMLNIRQLAFGAMKMPKPQSVLAGSKKLFQDSSKWERPDFSSKLLGKKCMSPVKKSKGPALAKRKKRSSVWRQRKRTPRET